MVALPQLWVSPSVALTWPHRILLTGQGSDERRGFSPPPDFHFPFWQSFFEGWDATKKKDKVKGGRQEPLPACESRGRAWVRGSGREGLGGGEQPEGAVS